MGSEMCIRDRVSAWWREYMPASLGGGGGTASDKWAPRPWCEWDKPSCHAVGPRAMMIHAASVPPSVRKEVGMVGKRQSAGHSRRGYPTEHYE